MERRRHESAGGVEGREAVMVAVGLAEEERPLRGTEGRGELNNRSVA